MSNLVDFNKEKNKIENKKQIEAKRKSHNDKVINKIKRIKKLPSVNVIKFYVALIIVVSIFVILFK